MGDENSLSAGFGVRESFIPQGGCFGASANFGFDDLADHFLFVGYGGELDTGLNDTISGEVFF